MRNTWRLTDCGRRETNQAGPEHPGVIMPEATFWFSSPFREWLGQRTLAVRWTERITLREVLDGLGTEHPAFRRNVIGGGLTQDAFNHLAAVIVEGDFLSLDAPIPEGAEVHVFTPLAGGADESDGVHHGRNVSVLRCFLLSRWREDRT